MRNRDRAADVIRAHGTDPCREPECIAKDLADAGLLAPDLPEPNELGDYLEQMWGTVRAGDGYVSFSTPTVLDHIGARFFAHALLAAANEAEGNQ